MVYGFHRKILHVFLDHHSFDVETPSEGFYRKYLGGSALGTYYSLKHTPPDVDPLSGDNTLTLAVGVVTGAPVPGQSRINATAKSPLTGGIGDSQSGGYFPAEFKFAGYDAMIIHGRSPEPVYLWINNGKIEFRVASHLMGRTTLEVERVIKEELGDSRIQILQTGVAGENQVRYASIISMANRANGRTGLGAVMGAKNLKAIAVRGSMKPEIFDGHSLKELARWGAKEFPNSDVYAMGLYGTAEVIAYQNSVGGLPTKNWDSGAFEGWESLDGQVMSKTILKRRDTCYACSIRCKRMVENEEDPYQLNPKYGGPEYETLSTFGSYCGISDLEAVAYANQLCNMCGMDTISCGATIAWAMDAYEKGILTKRDTGGIDLRFGNGAAMVQLVELIARREGIGDLLAEGSARAAQEVGKGSEDLVVAVKQQEVPAHMPQVKPSLGVIYAVNPFGADHQSSEHDPSFQGYPERMAQLGLDEGKNIDGLNEEAIRFALNTQYLYSALDSVSVCQFVYGPAWQLYDTQQLIRVIEAVTGWKMDVEELLCVGKRRLNLMRVYNVREGFSSKEDRLPKKFFKALTGGASDGVSLSKKEIKTAISRYYRQAGWDQDSGSPLNKTLIELGLDWLVDT